MTPRASCPFCGSTLLDVVSLPEEEAEYRVQCDQCLALGPLVDLLAKDGRDDIAGTRAAAEQAWNQRHGPAASPWIPVTERMPEERVTVLLFNGHRVGSGVWNGRWFFDEDEYQDDNSVTHWAEIRKP